MRDFAVGVESPSSVQLSWLPPEPTFWNGKVANYTVFCELLGPVASVNASTNGITMTFIKWIPSDGQPLANSPDPRVALPPLRQESILIGDLEEYHVYRFSVRMLNTAGQSQASMLIIQELPGRGDLYRTGNVCG